MFERSSRSKLRFTSSKGLLTTEDLWDLSLQSLDSIAKRVNKQLKESEEESFIETKSASNSEAELALGILKHIIAAKIAQKEAAKTRSENMARKARIEEVLMQKEDEDLLGKSKEELEAMLNA